MMMIHVCAVSVVTGTATRQQKITHTQKGWHNVKKTLWQVTPQKKREREKKKKGNKERNKKHAIIIIITLTYP